MNSNEYMRQYMLARYHKRRQTALDFLGNQCVECGSREDLEFDHKDRGVKKFAIARLWSINEERFWEEIKKCQILCRKCHLKKSILELGKQIATQTHGTLSSYRYCKCDLCRQAKSDWMKKYNEERRLKR